MSSQATQTANRENYWELMEQKRQEDIERIRKDPSLLSEIPEVKELMEALATKEAEAELLRQAGHLPLGLNLQYASYTKAQQKIAIGSSMIARNIVNTAVIHGRGIMGAGKLINKRQPLSLMVQLAIVLLGLLTLAIAGSILENTSVGAWAAASPSGVPNVVFLLVVFIIAFLLIRSRSRREA